MDSTPNADLPSVPAAPSTAERELEQALAFLSHDARSGHSSTLALLDLQRIQAEPMSPAQLLERIEANARRSLDVIDDFADLIRARRQPLQFDTIEMTDLLVEVVADMWTAAQQCGVKIMIAPGPASVVARADRGLLSAVLGKLLRDAVRDAAAGAEVRCGLAVAGNDGVFEIVESTLPAASVDARAAPRASRKMPSSLVFASAVAERHGGRAVQSASSGARVTRVVWPMGGVSDSMTA